jgi:hypothetical protein
MADHLLLIQTFYMQQEIYQKRSSTSQGAAKDRYAS